MAFKAFKFSLLLILLMSSPSFAITWNQFRANDLNNGFIPVQTTLAENPIWTKDVGPINGTSPVVASDGTIYVGNERGVLIAVNPDGTTKWRRELQRGWKCSTPSISDNGNIYINCNFRGYVTDHRQGEPKRYFVQQSKIFSLNPEGGIRWSYTPPTVTLDNKYRSPFFFTSVPKVLNDNGATYILLVEAYWDDNLMQRNFLIALNDQGELVDARYLSEAAFGEITGGGGFRSGGGEIGSKPLPSHAYKPENSIGIVNFPLGEFTQPIIIVSDMSHTITAFEWRNQGLSTQLWSRGGSRTIFDYYQTSPSIHYGGLVIFGRSDGRMVFLDPWTGEELNKPWPKLGSGVYSTPASFLRQIYLITHEGEFVALDSDGSVWKKLQLGAESMSSVAYSANHLYVNAADGIYTMSFEGEKEAFFPFTGGGNSSPAISNKGRVYALGGSGLFAFE